jgi:hypothetical protein
MGGCDYYGSNLVTNGDFATAVDKAAAKVVTDITKANPGVVTFAAAHGFVDGDVIYFASLDGMTELNTEYWKLRSNAGNTFELTTVWDTTSLDTSGYGAVEDSGNGRGQKCTSANWSEGTGCHPETDGAGALTGKMHWDGEQSSTSNTSQAGVATVGKPYRIKHTISNRGAGVITLRLGTGGVGLAWGADGTHYDYVTASHATLTLAGGSTFIGTIDDIEVVECYPVGRGGGAIRRRRRGVRR